MISLSIFLTYNEQYLFSTYIAQVKAHVQVLFNDIFDDYLFFVRVSKTKLKRVEKARNLHIEVIKDQDPIQPLLNLVFVVDNSFEIDSD